MRHAVFKTSIDFDIISTIPESWKKESPPKPSPPSVILIVSPFSGF
jgi:hypothetical protein